MDVVNLMLMKVNLNDSEIYLVYNR